MIDLTQTYEYKRQQYYLKHNIDFKFFNSEYGLRQCPIDRRNVKHEDTLEYYCEKVKELYDNIHKAIDKGDNPYFAEGALMDFNAILPNWKHKINETETFIYNYYKRFVLVDGELNVDQAKTRH